MPHFSALRTFRLTSLIIRNVDCCLCCHTFCAPLTSSKFLLSRDWVFYLQCSLQPAMLTSKPLIDGWSGWMDIRLCLGENKVSVPWSCKWKHIAHTYINILLKFTT